MLCQLCHTLEASHCKILASFHSRHEHNCCLLKTHFHFIRNSHFARDFRFSNCERMRIPYFIRSNAMRTKFENTAFANFTNEITYFKFANGWRWYSMVINSSRTKLLITNNFCHHFAVMFLSLMIIVTNSLNLIIE